MHYWQTGRRRRTTAEGLLQLARLKLVSDCHLRKLVLIILALLLVQYAVYLVYVSKSYKVWVTYLVNLTSLKYFKARCPEKPPHLDGVVTINKTLPIYEELEQRHSKLDLGGVWSPPNCLARHSVAIIVPYREREEHLVLFLQHMHPFLQKQQIHYGIYIVELAAPTRFNRGMLMNIGFVEALKIFPYDCFIFHDVDLLPENDQNLYTCPDIPRHMSVAVNTMRYKLPYATLFGGAVALRTEHFKLLNGFSNKYFGWGGEDDDLYNRLVYSKLNFTRYPANIARYKMLKHQKRNPNSKSEALLVNSESRIMKDGLNSLQYKVIKLELRRLYTWIYVYINEDQVIN